MSKNVIAAMTAKDISNQYLTWAKKYDSSMFMIVSKDLDKLVNIFNIDREVAKPRKDIAKWSEVSNYIGYFYDEVFHNFDFNNVTYPQNINNSVLCEILTDYTKTYDPLDDKDTWFRKIKELSIAHGFAGDTKAYKKNPQLFKGSIGDVAMILRLSLTAKSNTPDLYDIMKILGKERIAERLNNTISWISQSL
jgi:glutamyl-tRNA synthetase